MKYSQRLHGAMILAGFALLFAVIVSAYCQIDTVTIGAEKAGKGVYIVSRNDTVWAQSDTGNVLLWPVVDILTPIPHEINNGGDEMKQSKYKVLTVAQFREMLDEFLAEPEEALSVIYFKIRVKRQHSTGQSESLRIEDAP